MKSRKQRILILVFDPDHGQSWLVLVSLGQVRSALEVFLNQLRTLQPKCRDWIGMGLIRPGCVKNTKKEKEELRET